MKKQARNQVNRKLSESDGASAKPTGAVSGEFVTEMFEYDGGRQATVYVPPDPPEAIVFAGDGQGFSKWGRWLEKADVPSTMIVGVHGLTDETLRLHEYSPGFEPERFAAHEKFLSRTFADGWSRGLAWRCPLNVPQCSASRRGAGPRSWASASTSLRCGLLRLAWRRLQAGWRYAESASARISCRWHTGAVLPRERKEVGGRAARRNGNVVMNERAGSHGGAFWREEFPLMVAWAFGR
jgi:hypothetical protein